MDVHLPDTTLHVHVEGTGPTLLVMHGGLGLDHTYLRPWLDPLADDLRVVYYDHRGNGRSEWPESLEGVGHASWAADADALREHLGEERWLHVLPVYFHRYEEPLREGDGSGRPLLGRGVQGPPSSPPPAHGDERLHLRGRVEVPVVVPPHVEGDDPEMVPGHDPVVGLGVVGFVPWGPSLVGSVGRTPQNART